VRARAPACQGIINSCQNVTTFSSFYVVTDLFFVEAVPSIAIFYYAMKCVAKIDKEFRLVRVKLHLRVM